MEEQADTRTARAAKRRRCIFIGEITRPGVYFQERSQTPGSSVGLATL
jgi:hypothetical protein